MLCLKFSSFLTHTQSLNTNINWIDRCISIIKIQVYSVLQVHVDLTRERDYFQHQSEGRNVMDITPPNTAEKDQLVLELADAKTRIRSLKQEL